MQKSTCRQINIFFQRIRSAVRNLNKYTFTLREKLHALFISPQVYTCFQYFRIFKNFLSVHVCKYISDQAVLTNLTWYILCQIGALATVFILARLANLTNLGIEHITIVRHPLTGKTNHRIQNLCLLGCL